MSLHLSDSIPENIIYPAVGEDPFHLCILKLQLLFREMSLRLTIIGKRFGASLSPTIKQKKKASSACLLCRMI